MRCDEYLKVTDKIFLKLYTLTIYNSNESKMAELDFHSSKEITNQFKFSTYRVPQGRLIDTIPMLLNGTDLEGDVIEGEVCRRMVTLGELFDMRIHNHYENDKSFLRNTYYLVIGDVTIGNPDGSGEVIVKRYADVKEFVHSISPSTCLVDCSLSVNNDVYQTFKKSDAVIINPEVVDQFRNNAYYNVDTREKIYIFLTGSEKKVEDNLELVAEAREYKKRDVTLDNAMGFYPSYLKGLRPLWVWPVIDLLDSGISSNDGLNNNYARPIGIATKPRTIAQKKT